MSVFKRLYTLANQVFDLYIIIDAVGNAWFKSKEIAEILEYSNTAKAIQIHVFESNKTCFATLTKRDAQGGGNNSDGRETTNSCGDEIDTSKWHPQTIFINEAGLYQLIMRSKKPQAKDFQRWVTSEVLPSLRKTGQYVMSSSSMSSSSSATDIVTSTDLVSKSLMDMEVLKIKYKYLDQVSKLRDEKSAAESKTFEAQKTAFALEKQVALLKSDVDKQLVLFDAQLALAKAETGKLKAESDSKILQLTTALKKNFMEKTFASLLARDNIAQNDQFRQMLERVASRIAPEMSKIPHKQHAIAVYTYRRDDVCWFRVARAQIGKIEADDKRIERLRHPNMCLYRMRLSRQNRWLGCFPLRVFMETCANSTAVWNTFKVTFPEFVYGMNFSHSSTTFYFRTREDLYKRYAADVAASEALTNSQDPLPAHLEIFDKMAFIDEENCVVRCFTDPLTAQYTLCSNLKQVFENLRKETCTRNNSRRTRPKDYTEEDVLSFIRQFHIPQVLG